MKNWKTTAIGVIALIGLGFNAYTNGGFSVADFLLLITGIGFLAAKDGRQKQTLKSLLKLSLILLLEY